MSDALTDAINASLAPARRRIAERTITGFATDTVFDIDALRVAAATCLPIELTSLTTETPYRFLLIVDGDHATDTSVHCLYVGMVDAKLLPDDQWYQLHNRLTITRGEDGKIFVRPGFQA